MCVRLCEKQRQGGAVTSVRQKGMNKQVDGTKTMKQRKCLSDVKEFGEDPPGGGIHLPGLWRKSASCTTDSQTV